MDDYENDFYILIDAKVRKSFSDLISYVPKSSQLIEVPRMKICWASYSSVKAVLHLMTYAKGFNGGGDRYYTFMQGSDFPIKNKKDISEFFHNHDGFEFIEFNPQWYEFAKYKINYHHFFVNNRFYRHNKILKVLSHGIAKTEQKMNIKRNNLNIYSGSALFSITDDLCNFFLSNSEKILLISRYSLAADEVVFHTLLMDSAFANRLYNFELRDGNLYYIDWNRHEGSSPCTFSKNDLEILLSLPAQYLFARKFREGYSDDLVIKLYNHLKED